MTLRTLQASIEQLVGNGKLIIQAFGERCMIFFTFANDFLIRSGMIQSPIPAFKRSSPAEPELIDSRDALSKWNFAVRNKLQLTVKHGDFVQQKYDHENGKTHQYAGKPKDFGSDAIFDGHVIALPVASPVESPVT